MLFPCTRGRKSSREKILDAAAELVTEIGAGRLTLEAVAEKAGLSKGGLLYNFPTKEAAIAYAKKHALDYHLVPANPTKLKIQAYADNFR